MSDDGCTTFSLDEELDILIPKSKRRLISPKPEKQRTRVYIPPHIIEDDEVLQKLKLFGYALIIGSWLICIVSIGFVFHLWQWCFQFDPQNSKLIQKYLWVSTIYELIQEQNQIVENYYVVSFFLIFVVLWIWAVASWISMKLFRHSKGGGT